MPKEPKYIERPETVNTPIQTEPKRRGSRPRHDWREDLHPYYRLMDERDISVTQMYRQYQVSQPSLNNVVNYKDSYLRTLIELKLIIPKFDLIDYIVKYYAHNIDNFKNPSFDEEGNPILDFEKEIVNYCENNGITLKKSQSKKIVNDLQSQIESQMTDNRKLIEENDNLKIELDNKKQQNIEVVEENEKLKTEIENLQKQIESLSQKTSISEKSEKFFDKVETIFKESGLSQRAFVTKYGLPRTTMQKVLSRSGNLSPESIAKFSEKLGI